MRRSMMVVCAFCCLTSALATAAEVDYEKAVAEAVKAGKAADVNRLCTKWAAAEPGNEQPRIILGRTLLKTGMADRAIEQFELAGEANPLSPAPRCEMGLLFLRERKPDMAAKEFNAALRIDRTSLLAMLGRARVDLLKGDAKAALAQAQRALGVHAGSAEAHAGVGDCLIALDRAEEALAEFRQAARLDPSSADGLFGLAGACQLTGREEEAQEHWQRFLEAEPRGRRAEAVRQGWAVLRSEQLPSVCRAHLVWSPDGKRIMFGFDKPRIIDLRSRRIVNVTSPDGAKLIAPDWAPDGRRVVGYRRKGNRRPVRLYDLRPDGMLRAISPDPFATAATPRFSPDGTKLLLSGERHGVKPGSQFSVVDLSTGETKVIPWQNRAYPEAYWAAWAPDGNTVAFHTFHWQHHSTNRAIFMMGLDAPEAVQQMTRDGANNVHPKVSPDGLTIAYSGEGRDSTVSLVRTDGGIEPMVLSKGQVPGWAPDGRRLAYDTSEGIVIAHLGGLGRRPVRLAAQRKGNALSVVLTSQADDAQQVSFRWDAFDDQSFRIGLGQAEEGPLDVKPKEKAEWSLELDPTVAERAQTVRVRALNENGRGAVKLVDWQE